MKNKGKYEVVNNQEDEDGYRYYPESDSNECITNTETDLAKLAMLFPEAKRRISQFMISPSAKQAVPASYRNQE